MKIGILLADELRDVLKPAYGDYAGMFKRLLDGRDFQFAVYDVCAGAFPKPAECDGYIITGSRHGVYDRLTWIAPLLDFSRSLFARRIPQLGVCFGHQLVAQALGGAAGKSDKGWGLGLHNWTVENAQDWMRPPRDQIALLVSHQDQVLRLPPNARRLWASDFCPNAAFYIGDAVFCMQGHPEFDPPFMRELLEFRRDDVSAEAWQAAYDSAETPPDNAVCADWIGGFFRAARPAS